ncbi:transposable element Tcb2 transposase [Trichonephila clavipes]|nr:transposable element Tcb2 transposase [Trichonephila clavipes]
MDEKQIWNRFLETGSAGQRPGQGRRRAATPNEDRYLVLTARRHRNMNANLLQQNLRSATGTTVSTDCLKLAPWCRSVCSPKDSMCWTNIKASSRQQGVDNRACELDEK